MVRRAASLTFALHFARFPLSEYGRAYSKYINIDAFSCQFVTSETLLRYTLNSIRVNTLISGNLWKNFAPNHPRAASQRPVYDVSRPGADRRKMASVFSHAVAALGIGACFYRPRTPKRVWLIGALCSVIPDLDVIGFAFGIRYGDFWGHRGFSHSLVFAALLASFVVLVVFRQALPGLGRFALWTYLFLATASHGLLDALTDGGLGVAFFSPFINTRYFLPWRPIRVSPIGVVRFFSRHGLEVVRSELLWIWLPASALVVSACLVRRQRQLSFASRS